MFLRRIGSPVFLATLATAILFGALSWGNAQASSSAMPPESVLRQTMPMTGTMPGIAGGDMPMDHAMSEQEAMPGAMPMQPQMGSQGGMGQMMAHMTKMQGMMARMQRMMAGGMMSSGAPMTGTMPMAGMMQGDMGEMMAMMGEMQAMMAEMQGMMSSEMMAGQMQGQSMQGGMMGQMPMMGTMILIAPMPMGAMIQQTPGMSMMGQMPMMQGMKMGGMMGQGVAQADAPASASNATGEVQSGALGEIEVKVTPPDLSNIQGDTIDFTVDLNATGADLTFDLIELASLNIGGHIMPATTWEVAYDHGHHVNGVLKFPAHISGPVKGAELTVTDPAGGPDLTLTWPPVE